MFHSRSSANRSGRLAGDHLGHHGATLDPGGRPGYFRSIVAARRVSGIVLATTSDFDTTVGRVYALGVGVAKQVVFAPDELSKYGAIGTFGIQGPETDLTPIDVLPLNQSYSFAVSRRDRCA